MEKILNKAIFLLNLMMVIFDYSKFLRISAVNAPQNNLNNNSNIGAIVGGVVGGVIAVAIIVAIIIFMFLRYRRRPRSAYNLAVVPSVESPAVVARGSVTKPKKNPYAHTGFAIEESELEFDVMIGEGGFGRVYRFDCFFQLEYLLLEEHGNQKKSHLKS